MEKEHRCEAKDRAECHRAIWRTDWNTWAISSDRDWWVDIEGIRFCPFCGEELGAESESELAARLAKAAEIAKPDSNDPDDDPYDRPWEE